MRRTSRLVLLLGVFLAAVTFIVIIVGNFGPNGGQPAATPPPTSADTVIATVDIPLGTLVTKEMVEKQVLSITARDKGALADPSQAIGKTARVEITAGAQVVASAFSTQQAQATVNVPAGKRAFPIKISALTGVGNLVSVGDSVDILISLAGTAFPTVQVLADGTITVVAGLNPLSVKMPLLLQDVQIIQSIDQVAATAEGQAAASPAAVVTGKLLILAVTPAQAEVLLFVRDLNPENLPAIGAVEIDLVLRSPLDAGVTTATDGVILKTLIDKYGVLPPQLIQAVLPKP